MFAVLAVASAQYITPYIASPLYRAGYYGYTGLTGYSGYSLPYAYSYPYSGLAYNYNYLYKW